MEIEKTLEIWAANRKNLYLLTKEMTLEELNRIPNGFNNNVLWNLGHLVATQQNMHYRASGLPVQTPDGFGGRFKIGTRPEGPYSQEDADSIRQLLRSTCEQFLEDYRGGTFQAQPYHEWESMIKVKVGSIEEAVPFNLMHESLHLGSVMALKRALAAEKQA